MTRAQLVTISSRSRASFELNEMVEIINLCMKNKKNNVNMLGIFAKNIGYLTHSRPRAIIRPKSPLNLIKFPCSLVNIKWRKIMNNIDGNKLLYFHLI